jgi:hypothetical protein
MPSIGTEPRQIPVSTTYYSIPDSMFSLYVFVPGPTNYVKNYPDSASYMIQSDVQSSVYNWLFNQNIYTNNGPEGYPVTQIGKQSFVLRDMGKTFRLSVDDPNGVQRYFREVQILRPGPFPVPPPANSQIAGSSGVIGGSTVPNSDTQYATFYIPVTIVGLGGYQLPYGFTATGVYPIAGGQM